MSEWISYELGSISPIIGLLLGLALIITVIGFYRMVYFISVGYAFSITAMAIIVVILLRQNLSWVSVAQNVGLLIWSVRLGVYLVRRDMRPAYQAQMQPVYERTNNLPLVAKGGIWLSVALLYVAMFSPSLFKLSAPSAPDFSLVTIVSVVGLLVMFGGIILEWQADQQKADFKVQHPKDFCNIGLYRWVRCPNYLGEILFWVGNWIVGVGVYHSLLQWLISLIGVVCITLIMIGSTKRLEESQMARYGDRAEYQEYIVTTPVLFPFLPIYTLKNVRVYLE